MPRPKGSKNKAKAILTPTILDPTAIEEKMKAAEEVKVSKSRDVSLVGNGQVLGSLDDISRGHDGLGE